MSVKKLCGKVGMSKQNYYKHRRQRESRQIDEDLVVALVQGLRREHPRMGGRKLYALLKTEFDEAGVRIGRDQLFELLRRRGLLVPALVKSARTTDSRHCLPVCHNLIADLEPTAPNQIWVSDITYVRTEGGFVYLSLTTDRYSRKIVGHHSGDSLEAAGCVEALKEALRDLPADRYPIHHSDRGCQYCCHEYVDLLMDRGLPVSMTEVNHCYENAHAERVNGILKQEYGLGMTFKNLAQARAAIDQAIRLYNERRPHMSLQYCTPESVHRKSA